MVREFTDAVAQRESSGDHTVMNTIGYAGAYQFGEAALQDIGLYKGDGTTKNDWQGEWTGKYGVNSLEEFLASPEAQDAAYKDYMQMNWNTIERLGLDEHIGEVRSYEGKTYQVTAESLLFASQLGVGNVKKVLEGGSFEDDYGTSIDEYLYAGAQSKLTDEHLAHLGVDPSESGPTAYDAVLTERHVAGSHGNHMHFMETFTPEPQQAIDAAAVAEIAAVDEPAPKGFIATVISALAAIFTARDNTPDVPTPEQVAAADTAPQAGTDVRDVDLEGATLEGDVQEASLDGVSPTATERAKGSREIS